MTPLFPICRHRVEPRSRYVYHCQSPKVTGVRLVTAGDCGTCPFIDHASPSEVERTIAPVHPAMSIEEMLPWLDGPPRHWPEGWADWPITNLAHRWAMVKFLHELAPYPTDRYQGRGIVIAGGGRRYFPSLYVTIRAIRHSGCQLPIQVWHLGRDDEMPDRYAKILSDYQVECIDGDAVRKTHPCRILNGWELKVFAILHSPFEEVMLLDADCYPIHNPEALFDDPKFAELGATFWPDPANGCPVNWQAFGLTDSDVAPFETGQLLIHKQLCWKPLQLTWWLNDHSDWSFFHGYGDKLTFEAAWRWCQQPYHFYRWEADLRTTGFFHYGPDMQPWLIHRCNDKFRLQPQAYLSGQVFTGNDYHALNPLERECHTWLAELAEELEQPVPPIAQQVRTRSEQPTIRAYMLSCPERHAVLHETLANWRATDWGEDPCIIMDRGTGPTSAQRIIANARIMLERAASEPADYYLLLEDDILLNVNLRANLLAWEPLRDGWLWIGALFHPGFTPLSGTNPQQSMQRGFVRVERDGFHGGLGVVLSRAALLTTLQDWDVHGELPYDFRLSAISSRYSRGIVMHTPSLVQHRNVQSMAGTVGVFRAPDYDPFFRATTRV